MKAFRKLKVDEETLGKILEGVAKWAKTQQWLSDNGKYIPEPATFLNGRRWEDEIRDSYTQNTKKQNLSEADEMAEWLGEDDPRVIELRAKEKLVKNE